uniref:ABC transporter permease n=1 Tax=Anaerolinea thermolimosa TaxID=229919 RepID=A0A7C4KI32_9CHLR
MAGVADLGPGLRLIIATLLGSVIGLERELTGQRAGLRTHALVALGSALFTVIGLGYVQPPLSGSIPAGDPVRIVQAFQSGDALEIRRALNPIPESLVNATPYIFAGLAVALGFRSGLFNIGVEGQLFMGAAAATYVGYAVKGLPGFIHMPLAFLAGALGGAAWGFIPGWLKAKTGGHEVINTIMMNWIAFRLTEWLLGGPMTRPGSGGLPISPIIEKSAEIPQFFPAPIRFHLGFFIALGMAWLVHWLLFKTTWGFDLRTVGANPNAARYAGMNITRNIILAMTLSGALAGMAGANQILAVNRSMALGLSPGYGFDSIALALLGNSTPVGVILSSLLFGALRNGATRMELLRIPNDIVSIIQALILVFVAAPAIIRTIYRVKVPKEAEEVVFVGSWGGGNK